MFALPFPFICFFMILSSWNYRGAGGKAFPNIIKDMVRKYKIDILCLMEIKISGHRADCIVKKLGFTHWIRVEATSFVGRIWVL